MEQNPRKRSPSVGLEAVVSKKQNAENPEKRHLCEGNRKRQASHQGGYGAFSKFGDASTSNLTCRCSLDAFLHFKSATKRGWQGSWQAC